jgi:hypothetical protein
MRQLSFSVFLYYSNSGHNFIVCLKPPPLAVEAEGNLALRALVSPFQGNPSHPLCGWLLTLEHGRDLFIADLLKKRLPGESI